jgi:hypothetical protein
MHAKIASFNTAAADEVQAPDLLHFQREGVFDSFGFKGLSIPFMASAAFMTSDPAVNNPSPTTAIPARPCRMGGATGARSTVPPMPTTFFTISAGFEWLISTSSSVYD